MEIVHADRGQVKASYPVVSLPVHGGESVFTRELVMQRIAVERPV